MQDYLLNFIVWWYGVFCRNAIKALVYRTIYLLNLTNTLPMVKNLFTPLFQDNSNVGRLMSLLIRPWWIFFGTMITIVAIIPRFLLTILYIILPFVPILQILNFLYQIR
jgi:hypothetical protein